MKIAEFGIEQWMNEYENECEFNLAETCVESLTVGQLLDLCEKREHVLDDLDSMKLTYGSINGTDRLRDLIYQLYERQGRENIIVTHGAIGANALVYSALVSRRDTVITAFPTYQQHYSIPESIGAEVKILTLQEENCFLPDLGELRRMATKETCLIALNNPNNPTGALMDESALTEIADIARDCGAYILCDEVYRGMDQDGDGFTASIADIYEKGISTGSMSKAYSLAGLRLGWIAGPEDVIAAVTIHRDYNTISVGMIDDYLASIALEHSSELLKRNRAIVHTNLRILDDWVTGEPLISYVKPQSGTTALLKYELDIGSRDFCVRLLTEQGVLLTPGSVFDMEGYVRIGYANATDILRNGLTGISEFLAHSIT